MRLSWAREQAGHHRTEHVGVGVDEESRVGQELGQPPLVGSVLGGMAAHVGRGPDAA